MHAINKSLFYYNLSTRITDCKIFKWHNSMLLMLVYDMTEAYE